MGIGGISIWQLLIILAIVILIFGTKRLKGLGGDLGAAIKGLRRELKDDPADPPPLPDDKDKPAAKRPSDTEHS